MTKNKRLIFSIKQLKRKLNIKKSFLHILDVLMGIYVIACPFIMQIRKSETEYSTSVYFNFDAALKTKILFCVLSIALILVYGFVSGLNKRFNRFILFLVVGIALKVSIFIFDFIVPEISEFLWAIYCAPIAYIHQELDIFVFVFYDILFFAAFAIGLFISKNNKKHPAE